MTLNKPARLHASGAYEGGAAPPFPAPPCRWLGGASASGIGGCSLALVPAAGGRPVCLLLRRRHIVCVRRGERGYCRCHFHRRYLGSRGPRSSGRAGEPRQQGEVVLHVLRPGGLSPSPALLAAHSCRGRCSPSRTLVAVREGAERGGGIDRCEGGELAVRLLLAGGRLDWAETKGQLGGGGRARVRGDARRDRGLLGRVARIPAPPGVPGVPLGGAKLLPADPVPGGGGPGRGCW